MRMNLHARLQQPSTSVPHATTAALTVTLRPSNNHPGDFEYQTDSRSLLRLLRNQTDLNSVLLEHFEGSLRFGTQARIPAVSLNDKVLTDIGYFMA